MSSDKAARRRKRQERERQEQRRRAVDQKPFDNKAGDEREALLRLIRRATEEYSTLLKVVEAPPAAMEWTNEQRLDFCGLGKRYKPYIFESNDPGYPGELKAASGSRISFGGMLNIIGDERGNYRTVIFLWRDPASAKIYDAANLAVFLHELGHADDFHHGINMRIGELFDTEAMELHAHEFACRRLKEGNYLVALAVYVSGVVQSLTQHPAPSISRAALRFAETQTFSECKAALGPLADIGFGFGGDTQVATDLG